MFWRPERQLDQAHITPVLSMDREAVRSQLLVQYSSVPRLRSICRAGRGGNPPDACARAARACMATLAVGVRRRCSPPTYFAWLALLALGVAQAADLSEEPFVNENGQKVSASKEAIEHALIQKYISPSSTGVLEIGVRYGTSSCAIAKHLRRGGAGVVSVEADARIWNTTERNLRVAGCFSNLVRGVVGSKPMVRSKYRSGSGYTTVFKRLDETAVKQRAANTIAVAAFTPDELAQSYALTFDAVVADCEGCFASIVQEFPAFVGRLQTIILEMDYGLNMQMQGFVNYTALLHTLESEHGFHVIERFAHPCCRRPPRMLIEMVVLDKRRHRGERRGVGIKT